MRLYPPRVSRRSLFTRLVYNGNASIPAQGIMEMRLYPLKVLRRCVYTRLSYH